MAKRALAGLTAALLALGAVAAAAQEPATPLWSITSDDCASVHADGEPWDECGFQSFAANADLSRVLTASALGVVQLWDGEGRELRRFHWPDDAASGATGFPNARLVIIGGTGVVVVHQNQLLVIDLADGRERLRRTLDVMMVRELRRVGERRLFAEISDREWRTQAREIDLATGDLTPIGTDHLTQVTQAYWLTHDAGGSWLHRDALPDVRLERSCMPAGPRYCIWTDRPGRSIHVLDVPAARWSRLDFDRPLNEFTMTEVVDANGTLLASACWLDRTVNPSRYDCALRDFASGREIARLTADSTPRGIGGVDEQGRPEFRVTRPTNLSSREQIRIGMDGVVRMIEPSGRASLLAPGGGMILPGAGRGDSILVSASGQAVARLPFPAQVCGNGWPGWSFPCPVSPDGSRWLIPVSTSSRTDEREVHRLGLTLFALPAPR